jgi:hypothetical protein
MIVWVVLSGIAALVSGILLGILESRGYVGKVDLISRTVATQGYLSYSPFILGSLLVILCALFEPP